MLRTQHNGCLIARHDHATTLRSQEAPTGDAGIALDSLTTWEPKAKCWGGTIGLISLNFSFLFFRMEENDSFQTLFKVVIKKLNHIC